jgi:hypothetical protein
MLGGGESNELFIKRRRIRSVGIDVGKMELVDDADASNFIVYDEVHSCIHPKLQQKKKSVWKTFFCRSNSIRILYYFSSMENILSYPVKLYTKFILFGKISHLDKTEKICIFNFSHWD